MTEQSEEQQQKNRWAEVQKRKREDRKKKRRQPQRSSAVGDSRFGDVSGTALLGATDLSGDLIAVHTVVNGADPERLEASVLSILEGSHKNVQMVLISDGEALPTWDELPEQILEDDRVVCLSFEEAAGPNARYAQAAVGVGAVSFAKYIAFQGPHDISKPERLTEQLAALLTMGADACFTGAYEGHHVAHASTEPTPGFGELAPPTGLFRAGLVPHLGGIYPAPGGLRLLTSATALLGRVVTTKLPLYTRNDDHMWDHPDEEVTEFYRETFGESRTSAATGVNKIKGHLLRLRDRGPLDELNKLAVGEAEPVRASDALLDALMAAIPPEIPASDAAKENARQFYADLVRPSDEDRARIDQNGGRTILVAGAGPAAYAAALYSASRPTPGVKTVILEAASDVATALKRSLELHRLTLKNLTVRDVPLREYLVDPVGYTWYDVNPTTLVGDRLDVLYIDGPRDKDRHGALFHLSPVMVPGSEIWLPLDEHQDRPVNHWAGSFHLTQDTRGAHLSRIRVVPDPSSADVVAVTILTGLRPKLLRQTLKTLEGRVKRLVSEAHVTVLVNGGDADSLKVVKAFDWVDETYETEEVLHVANAVSSLMERVPAEAKFVLHLEDDWRCVADGWLERAVSLLRSEASVGQVLLSGGASQSKATVNKVTGRRTEWADHRSSKGFRYRMATANFTLQPSLVRRSLLSKIWPSENEEQMRERFHEEGHRVACLGDAAFHHEGEGQSLRAKLGRD